VTRYGFLAGDLAQVVAPNTTGCEGVWEVIRTKHHLVNSDGSAYICRRESDGSEETFMSDELAPADAITKLGRIIE
jgi:hypothetical protein